MNAGRTRHWKKAKNFERTNRRHVAGRRRSFGASENGGRNGKEEGF